MDIQYLMRQAKKLEKAVAEAKEQLGTLSVEGESGGGMVKVVMNGRCEVTRISIDPEAITPDDRSMLEDLVAAAVNAATTRARAAADAHLEKATGGIKIPGLG